MNHLRRMCSDYFGERFYELVDSQAEWSQATFGSDRCRGPIGALQHLIEEAEEAIEAIEACGAHEEAYPESYCADVHEELADCFLLVIEASRRCNMKIDSLLSESEDKHETNRQRKWQPPTDLKSPVKHVRSER